MPSSAYPKPAIEVISLLADIFRHQGRRDMVELCESAHACIDEVSYDNWNGGTYVWTLRLEVPTALFVSLKDRLSAVEAEIGAELSILSRQYPNDTLISAQIYPAHAVTSSIGQQMTPSEIDIKRVWGATKFRLFLSHLSVDKRMVSELKSALAARGVSAFVAHEDIEPSLKWKNEIELALRSMNALAAILTPTFHESPWTDQEIGWALGRNLLVISVGVGVKPYGFFGENQGIIGSGKTAEVIAAEIVRALLLNSQTHGEMRRSLVRSFQAATSYNEAKLLKAVILTVEGFPEDERAILQKACQENGQVKSAFGVTEALSKKFSW